MFTATFNSFLPGDEATIPVLHSITRCRNHSIVYSLGTMTKAQNLTDIHRDHFLGLHDGNHNNINGALPILDGETIMSDNLKKILSFIKLRRNKITSGGESCFNINVLIEQPTKLQKPFKPHLHRKSCIGQLWVSNIALVATIIGVSKTLLWRNSSSYSCRKIALEIFIYEKIKSNLTSDTALKATALALHTDKKTLRQLNFTTYPKCSFRRWLWTNSFFFRCWKKTVSAIFRYERDRSKILEESLDSMLQLQIRSTLLGI